MWELEKHQQNRKQNCISENESFLGTFLLSMRSLSTWWHFCSHSVLLFTKDFLAELLIKIRVLFSFMFFKVLFFVFSPLI